MELSDIVKQLEAIPPEERARLQKEITKATNNMKFVPNPGPQTIAFLHPADIMLYGGTAGSGKSALISGLALTQHRRSLILRRKYADLSALADELVKMNGTRDGFTSMPRPKLRTTDGRFIEFGAAQHLGDEESFQGQAHDLKAFDEVTQFLESQVRYIIGWNRSAEKGQRCRVVFASNPPTSADGDWIIGMFRPWLDPTHSNPAKHGELRWFVTDPDGKDMEVDSARPVEFPGRKEPSMPKSRTFIPGKLSDNPFLANTGYAATLDSLPEPLRSALRDGNFMLSRKDDLWQVIPTEWVRQAIGRWGTHKPSGVPMCAMGVDVASGGDDETTIAMRYDGWYDKIAVISGKFTPEGKDISGQVIKHRRDGATVILDMGGGYGGSPMEHLKNNGVAVTPYKGNMATDKRSKEKMGYANVRSAAWWAFREALDPSQPGGSTICLPDDPKLLADLTAPTFEAVSKGFKVETKEDVVSRLGRSPDRGDAVIMAWFAGLKGVAPSHPGQTSKFKAPSRVVMGHEKQRRR